MSDPADRAVSDPSAGPLANLLTDLVHVLQGNVRLARAEVAQGLRGMVRGAGLMIAAALLGVVAVNTVAGAAVFALVGQGLSPAWAGVAVGAALLAVAYAAVRLAVALLDPKNLLPLRTFSRWRDDVETLKSMVIHDANGENPLATETQPGADRGAA